MLKADFQENGVNIFLKTEQTRLFEVILLLDCSLSSRLHTVLKESGTACARNFNSIICLWGWVSLVARSLDCHTERVGSFPGLCS